MKRDATNVRKIQHIKIINRDREVDRRKMYFDDVVLAHRALPEIKLSDADPSTSFLGKPLSFPLLISCMTGGDHNLVRKINRNLAEAAEATGVAMGVGSQRVLFTNPKSASSFALRKYAPKALLFGNLGAVQLNYGFGLRECSEAVDVLGADALCLHLNPLQEAVQPEGDTNFKDIAAKMGEVQTGLGVPVIAKEVGAGIGPADARLLLRHGIRIVDIAGSGGTSWSRIEHHRRDGADTGNAGIVFQDWGIPTPMALELLKPLRKRLALIASGGVRNGLDMVKAVVLGASLCGIASPFLKPAMKSTKAVVQVIEQLRRQFATGMFLLGVKRVSHLQGRNDLILGCKNQADSARR